MPAFTVKLDHCVKYTQHSQNAETEHSKVQLLCKLPSALHYMSSSIMLMRCDQV